MGVFFDWRTPSSLFPPSAIISITDDNSTNFLARPAAFGPLLPVSSLTGQVWIGSGFGDDHLGRGGSGAGVGGELGCSDVPGWDDGTWYGSGSRKQSSGEGKKSATDFKPAGGKSKIKRSSTMEQQDEEDARVESPAENDGTDDYLHHPLRVSGTKGDALGNAMKPTHADIQSLQESAEIGGKIVLLSRGGCGFLEKVKWVQRRGGVALIVGDNVRGGPLVTMYARGETSNVTIPSVFISHMTAQLLSSLMPTGSLGGSEDDSSRPSVPKIESKVKLKSSKKVVDKPSFTTTLANSNSLPTTKATKVENVESKQGDREAARPKHVGWFSNWFGSNADHTEDSRRPPSSGSIGLVLHEEVEDELTGEKIIKPATTSTTTSTTATATPKHSSGDGFVIGVQDWRDRDLVAEQKEQQLKQQLEDPSSPPSKSPPEIKTTQPLESSPKGGSITPSSGEYAKSNHEAVDIPHATESKTEDITATSHQISLDDHPDSSRSWLGRLFHHSNPSKSAKADPILHEAASQAAVDPEAHHDKSGSSSNVHHPNMLSSDGPEIHEGLWVTLSPASMSSSPFFDTLLVLVVSPLVTLTVVYALLLLRSRIRRRRWRAPKSVVERLPVRTYQTMPSGTTSSATSSVASLASVTTPLLPTASRPINTQARPRSRTASEVPQGSSVMSDGMASPSLEQVEEKRAAGLAEWRRRYGGKQRECVVCLDEYVDGVSRVMSLPCGHEFHAECM